MQLYNLLFTVDKLLFQQTRNRNTYKNKYEVPKSQLETKPRFFQSNNVQHSSTLSQTSPITYSMCLQSANNLVVLPGDITCCSNQQFTIVESAVYSFPQ